MHRADEVIPRMPRAASSADSSPRGAGQVIHFQREPDGELWKNPFAPCGTFFRRIRPVEPDSSANCQNCPCRIGEWSEKPISSNPIGGQRVFRNYSNRLAGAWRAERRVAYD